MPPNRRSLFAAAILASLLVAAAHATTPEQVTVVREGGAYNVRMSIDVDASAARVREVLTDYAHLHRINPSVISSEVLPSPAPGVTRVRTHLKSCLWFFCREFELVEDLRSDPGGGLHALIVGGLSDMKSGSSLWTIKEAGNVTRLSYESTMEPGFWIPPLIGPKAIIRNLTKNLLITADNLERLSREAQAGSVRGLDR